MPTFLFRSMTVWLEVAGYGYRQDSPNTRP